MRCWTVYDSSILSPRRLNANLSTQLIKDLKSWRNAWEDMLKLQYDTSEAFAALYKPIEGSGEDEVTSHQPAQTPAQYMQKCLGLQKEYSDEKADLAQEIEMITNKLIKPAEEAKQSTKLLHKTLKHRDNMKLDYERYNSRVEHTRKKETRTTKDEANLQAQEAKMQQSRIDYETADDQVKQTFPPVTEAVLSLLPHLLANQVMLQTTLVGQLYTVLDAYTRKFGFPNPAPADGEIISTWDHDFTSFRKELESGIQVIAHGKVVHMSMALPAEKGNTVTGLGIRTKVTNTVRKDGTNKPTPTPHKPSAGSNFDTASQYSQEQEEEAPPKPPRPGGGMPSPGPGMAMNNNFRNASTPITGVGEGVAVNNIATARKTSMPMPSPGSLYSAKSPPPYDYKPPTALMPGYPNQASNQAAGGATPPSRYQTPINGQHSPLPSSASNAAGDYFGNRRPSNQSIASSAASIAAAKKKPPPPVPTKRLPSGMQAQYVTALYDFEGQSEGDLDFREGESINVVKKKESTDDWWDGELRGRVGTFPANYVQL